MRRFEMEVAGCVLAALALTACGRASQPTPAEPPNTTCPDCTLVRGTVHGVSAEEMSKAGLLVMPSEAVVRSEEFVHTKASAEGTFELLLHQPGPHHLVAVAPGRRFVNAAVYADGGEVVVDLHFPEKDPEVAELTGDADFVEASPRTRRFAKLQSSALCPSRLIECPAYESLRTSAIRELADEKDELLRIELLIAYFEARHEARTEHEHDEVVARELRERLAPTAQTWWRSPKALVVMARTLGDWDYVLAAFEQTEHDHFASMLVSHVMDTTRDSTDAKLLALAETLRAHPRAQQPSIARHVPLRTDPVDRSPKPGEALPSLELETIEGATVDALVRGGELTIVHFWATWHAPSKKPAPEFRRLQERFGAGRLQVVSLAVDDSLETVTSHLQSHGDMPWHHAVLTPDVRAPLNDHFDLQRVPSWFLVDSEGKVVMSSRWPPLVESAERFERLEAFVEERLGD